MQTRNHSIKEVASLDQVLDHPVHSQVHQLMLIQQVLIKAEVNFYNLLLNVYCYHKKFVAIFFQGFGLGGNFGQSNSVSS